jgi:hypothetical protein
VGGVFAGGGEVGVGLRKLLIQIPKFVRNSAVA